MNSDEEGAIKYIESIYNINKARLDFINEHGVPVAPEELLYIDSLETVLLLAKSNYLMGDRNSDKTSRDSDQRM